ncbi:MAG: hypothetical protein KBD29_03575, partial [Candidatus Magasanikbacteria bacterium]|nr:hypothetical protein [Candidatus Magasanikbacteria bacterium]
MTFKEKVELAMYAMLWAKAMTTFVLTRNYACWYDFSVTIVTSPRLFTEKTAENVFREFQRTPHEETHLRDLEFKLANWRPKLAVKLDISAPTYDFLMETVRDPRFSDRLVMYLFERFMD